MCIQKAFSIAVAKLSFMSQLSSFAKWFYSLYISIATSPLLSCEFHADSGPCKDDLPTQSWDGMTSQNVLRYYIYIYTYIHIGTKYKVIYMLIYFYLFIRAITSDKTCVLEMTMYMHNYLFYITVK